MSRPAYYNEHDPRNVAALRNLIAGGMIAPGIVDDRSIEDVRPGDLDGFGQLHFFAGHGIWSYALRRAGVPDGHPVITGSCPCQPFSAAGEGNGFADERHLWPHLFYLVGQVRARDARIRRFKLLLGEQVASPNAEPWLDLVSTDLEALGFAVGAVAFPAAGVGAPNIRDRTYWMAHADDEGLQGWAALSERAAQCVVRPGRMDREGRQPSNGFWRDVDWLGCSDGRWRPVEPGTFPLASRAPADVAAIHAYGNAINAEAALTFIQCVQDAGLLPV